MQHFVLIPRVAEIVRESGDLLRRYLARKVEIEYKNDRDLVTAADCSVEALIRRRLHENFPEHGIYGEEGSRERLGGDYCWYVDPLDGTANFAHQFPHFAVSMGLEQRLAGTGPQMDGVLEAGVIYDPVRDELFAVERGRGATLNGNPICVSRIDQLSESLLAIGLPGRKQHRNLKLDSYYEFALRPHGVRRAGSAALDLAYLACGRVDGFWDFDLKPWDIAAGILLVEEACGRVTDFAGGQWRLRSSEIAASNGLLHSELIRLFEETPSGFPAAASTKEIIKLSPRGDE